MDLEKGTINGYRFDMDFINIVNVFIIQNEIYHICKAYSILMKNMINC